MAVLPEWQGRGVGADRVRAGLHECRELGRPVVVVLGDPGYHGRFGFHPAAGGTVNYSNQFRLDFSNDA